MKAFHHNPKSKVLPNAGDLRKDPDHAAVRQFCTAPYPLLFRSVCGNEARRDGRTSFARQHDRTTNVGTSEDLRVGYVTASQIAVDYRILWVNTVID